MVRERWRVFFVAVGLAACTAESGGNEAAYCSGVRGERFDPVFAASGTMDLPLPPDPAVGRAAASPPPGEWHLAIESQSGPSLHSVNLLGCVRENGVERWSVSVELQTTGPVTGAPLTPSTTSLTVPFLAGSISWRDAGGRPIDQRLFGGPLAAGGTASVTRYDPAARALQLTYAGFVDLMVDVTWDEARLFPSCAGGVACPDGWRCETRGAEARCLPAL